jgi:hypothetical protein
MSGTGRFPADMATVRVPPLPLFVSPLDGDFSLLEVHACKKIDNIKTVKSLIPNFGLSFMKRPPCNLVV